jgi:hypothetical protein
VILATNVAEASITVQGAAPECGDTNVVMLYVLNLFIHHNIYIYIYILPCYIYILIYNIYYIYPML